MSILKGKHGPGDNDIFPVGGDLDKCVFVIKIQLNIYNYEWIARVLGNVYLAGIMVQMHRGKWNELTFDWKVHLCYNNYFYNVQLGISS